MWVLRKEGQRVLEPHNIHIRDDEIEAPVHNLVQHENLGPGHAAPALVAPLQACRRAGRGWGQGTGEAGWRAAAAAV